MTFDVMLKGVLTSQYGNYNFNSFCKFGDKYLGAKSSGLFQLAGDDDDGVDIDASFEPVTTDFGMTNPKSYRHIHFGGQTWGALDASISTDGKAAEVITLEPFNSKTGQQRISKEISRAKQGRYLTANISNVDGADFSIDSIAVDFYQLSQLTTDY